jgi:flagellar M-ring protein FliF
MMNSLEKTWAGLTVGQRLALAGVLAVVFGGIILIAQWAERPPYGVLFSNLEPQDAGAVTGKLRELKVDYHLSQGGRAIEVPADKVYDLRLSMASEGLPRGGSAGFELFDKTSFAATDFSQHLNYRRALEGELERTIRQLDGVTDTRVHLAIPEKQLFIDKEEPVTASVVLHMRPGYQVPERQVAGIVHLVSSAVEGLKPDNVTVHDAQGELLSASGGPGPQLTGGQVELQERYERRLESALQRLGDQVLGPGRSAIRVSAELNWDQMETTSETFRPSGPNGRNLPVQEQDTRESYAPRSARPASGIPGATSNLKPLSVTANGDGNGQYTNTRADRHYAVSKVVQRRIEAPGKIRRLSIAVLLDQTIGTTQQQALKNAFAAAAGLEMDPVAEGGRGDRIELLPMKFDRSAETEATRAADTEAKRGLQSDLARNGAAVLIVVILAVASLLVGRRLLAARPEPFDALVGGPAPTLATAGAGTYSGPAGAGRIESGGSTRHPGAPASRSDRVRQLAAERPDEVARQLQSWMAEP